MPIALDGHAASVHPPSIGGGPKTVPTMKSKSTTSCVLSQCTIVLSLALLLAAAPAWAQTRLKDIANVQGVRSNQLVGYGLVVGLNGTGDGSNSLFTPQTIQTMLAKFGVNVSSAGQPKNTAAVVVTAELPAFVKNGSTIDVVVSSLGDASSLQGGTLIQTPLKAANGLVYAAAQGSVSIGGLAASGGGGGASVTKNHPTAGRVPGGAIVEQEVPTTFAGGSTSVEVTLDQPDFATAANVESAIRQHLPDGAISARAIDAATVQVDYAPGTDPINLIAALEVLPIQTDEAAKVVIDERTGTVVINGTATVSACAVAHGSLTVTISNSPIISQPLPRSKGQTVVAPHADIKVTEDSSHLIGVPESTSLDKVITSLNALGVKPLDLIAILQSMKEAGALHADIEVQ